MWKDSETTVDFLDFDYLKDSLNDIIQDDKLTPASIGIFGGWGSGKSSLMNMSMENLSNKDGVLCIKFNGWLFEGYEDAKTALIGSILDGIQAKKTLKDKAKETISKLLKSTDKFKLVSKGIKYGIDLYSTGGIGTALELFLSKVKNNSDSFEPTVIRDMLNEVDNSKDLRKDITEFQNNFSTLLEQIKIQRLVVYIDELDRCNPDTILDTLEAIRLFLFTEKTSFVIGADEQHIEYAVRNKFKEIQGYKLNVGRQYLEKLIQYPIRIPSLSEKEVELYILFLFLEKELDSFEFGKIRNHIMHIKSSNKFEYNITYDEIFEKFPDFASKTKEALNLTKQISSVLAKGLNGNPRHCKRFLNTLVMREKMAKFRSITFDIRILAKIMLLEYFKPELFRQMGKIQANANGKINGIEKWEENPNTPIDDFSQWEDIWVKAWLLISPSLKDIDLRPYYYLTRESLAEGFNLNQQNLSPDAQIILKNLQSQADISIRNALSQKHSINQSEAETILQTLIVSINYNDKIDTKALKAILEWGANIQTLHTSTIIFLQRINGNNIGIEHIPLIFKFAKDINDSKKCDDILNNWQKENPKLKSVISSNR